MNSSRFFSRSRRFLSGCLVVSSLVAAAGCSDTEVCDSGWCQSDRFPAFVESHEWADGVVNVTDGGSYELALWHETGKPVVGDNGFVLDIALTDEKYADVEISGAQIWVDCYMPEAQHPMPVSPVVEPQAGGTYALRNLNFDRPGLWQIEVDLAWESFEPESTSFVFLVE